MGIRKRGKKYYIDVYYKGTRIRECVGESKRLAERVYAKRKAELVENKFFDKRKVSKTKLSELVELYLEYSKTHKRSYERDRSSTKTLLKYMGDRKLNQITPLRIEEYIKTRLNQISYRKKGKVSPATVNRELACLKHMFTKAIEWSLIYQNPVKKVKSLKERNKRLRFLSAEEIEKLLNCCSGYLMPIVKMAIFSGMRKSEILNLKWKDVDFHNNLILLTDTKSGKRREIPLNRTLKEVMLSVPRHFKSDYIFCHQDGKPYSDLRKSFNTTLKKAGIEDFTFHDLRHTFASHMVMNGVDINTLKEILGHSSIAMTQRYAHLAPSFKKKAMRNIDTILSQNRGQEKTSSLSD
jgi:integrase